MYKYLLAAALVAAFSSTALAVECPSIDSRCDGVVIPWSARPLIGEVGHVVDEHGKPAWAMACAWPEGFDDLMAGGKVGLDTGCNVISGSGTFIVRALDRKRGLSQVCWPNGFRMWVRRVTTAAGDNPEPDLKGEGEPLKQYGWSKCGPLPSWAPKG